MTIARYTKPSIITAHFTLYAQATKLAICSTSVDPTWTVAQVNSDKLCEATLTRVVDSIGGDFSETTASGLPVLRIAEKSAVLGVGTGNGLCFVLHDGTDVIHVEPITSFAITTGALFKTPSFDISYT